MKLTRRQLFTGRPFRESSPSSPQLKPSQERLDQSVESISELLLIAMALELAFTGMEGKLTTLDVQPRKPMNEDLGKQEAFVNAVTNFLPSIQTATTQLNQLQDIWYQSYRKSRQVPYQVDVCSGEGESRSCHTETRYRTEYYWDEPDELKRLGLNHDSIGSSVGGIQNLSNTIEQLRIGIPALPGTWDGLGTYTIEATHLDKTTRDIARGVIFGGVAISASIYEEVVTWLVENNYLQAGGKLQDISQNNIKRRAFMKGVVALMNRHLIRRLRLSQAEHNKDIESRVKKSIEDAVTQRTRPGDEAFSVIFNMSFTQLLAFLENQYALLLASIEVSNSYEDKGAVLPQLQSTARILSTCIGELKQFVQFQSNGSYAFPPSFTELLQDTRAHRSVRSAVNSENGAVKAGFYKEVFVFLFANLGLVITGEALTQLSDRVMEREVAR